LTFRDTGTVFNFSNMTTAPWPTLQQYASLTHNRTVSSQRHTATCLKQHKKRLLKCLG